MKAAAIRTTAVVMIVKAIRATFIIIITVIIGCKTKSFRCLEGWKVLTVGARGLGFKGLTVWGFGMGVGLSGVGSRSL